MHKGYDHYMKEVSPESSQGNKPEPQPAPKEGGVPTPPPSKPESKPGWVEKYVLRIVDQAIKNHEAEHHGKK